MPRTEPARVPIPLPLLTRRPDAPASAAPAGGLDPAVASRVASHPCYSQDAHRYYARMHVPVAPGCTISCNYCNRKFDCANESRPGVTSTLLTPEQALAKVKYVARKVPQLSVVGVAGPGEPLANARRTLGTLELLARDCPDLTLCLSTNGLALPDHVDAIAALGVEHVTVTVNMTDPEVGAQIYRWVTFRGRRYTGREAAAVLSDRQLAGIQALTERGILCKVNSVLIPGVNDEHLVDVSRTVRELGAFLHNVMPLVSAPEHGTAFGLAGVRGPSPQELLAVQQRCEQAAGDGHGQGGTAMGMMRHCRQCRADAVGMLGQDRGEEFADVALAGPGAAPGADPAAAPAAADHDVAARRQVHARIEQQRALRQGRRDRAAVSSDPAGRPDAVVLVAVATGDGASIDRHFGQAEEFAVYEAGAGWARLVGVRSVSRYCGGPSECGDEGAALERIVGMLSDCAAVLCVQVGDGPQRALAAAGVEVVQGRGAVDTAVVAAGARLASPGQAAVLAGTAVAGA